MVVCVFSIQHFVCAHCEKAFEGRRHFEKKGLAYCERDYKFVSPCLPVSNKCTFNYSFLCPPFLSQLFGDVCFSCNKPCRGDGKLWYLRVLSLYDYYTRPCSGERA